MTNTVEKATADLAAAKSAYLDELRQDRERSEGSGAQERRREEHRQLLRDRIAQCESDLAEATRHQHQLMVSAFEAKYQRDWNDPTGNELKAIWIDAWTAATASA